MSVVRTLTALGGIAGWAELREHHSKREILRAAVDEIDRVAVGRYVLPSVSGHLRLAAASGGTLSHLSAAQAHGWKVKTPPELADVTVARKRRVRPPHTFGRRLHHADLSDDDIADGVTTPLRTVLDCARSLPFDEALTVADSALRSEAVGRGELIRAAATVRGPGARAVRRVAAHADPRASGPIESVLRALTLDCGLTLTPQLTVFGPGVFAIVDLGSEELRLAVEADGFGSHGTRAGLRQDCARHTGLSVIGWASLRYSYEAVMFQQDWVRWTLTSWQRTRNGQDLEHPPRAS